MDENTFVIDLLLPADSYDTIYTDMDDTIVIRDYGAFRHNLVNFFLQQKALGKRIIILTRAFDPRRVLPYCNVDLDLFDEIISVGNAPKSQYIPKGAAAIFIDDKEVEREDVFNNAKVLSFDPNDSWFVPFNSISSGIENNREVTLERLRQELASMQKQLQTDQINLQNFARIARQYFDGVQDCDVIDMNAAVEDKNALMRQILEQRQQLAKKML